MKRYRIIWRGLFDPPTRPKRILTMQAKSKVQAAQLHEKLFPAKTRKVEVIR